MKPLAPVTQMTCPAIDGMMMKFSGWGLVKFDAELKGIQVNLLTLLYRKINIVKSY